MNALDFEDTSEEAAKFAAKRTLRALDAFDQLTGGFLRAAQTKGEFESRLRYATAELDLIADSHYDGDVRGMTAAMVEQWQPKEAKCADCGDPDEETGHMGCQYPQDHEGSKTAEIPEAFKDQQKKKKDDGGDDDGGGGNPFGKGSVDGDDTPKKKKDKPKGENPFGKDESEPKSDDDGDDKGEDEEGEALGTKSITVDEAIPGGTELQITLEVAPPKESAIDWERFAGLEAEDARDYACAYILARKPADGDEVLAYMSKIIGAKEGYQPHVVEADLLRTASLVQGAYLRAGEGTDWYEAGYEAGSAARGWDPAAEQAPSPYAGRVASSIPDIFGSWEAATDEAKAEYELGFEDGWAGDSE